MSDLREEISECLDQLKDALDVITERDKRIAELEAENERKADTINDLNGELDHLQTENERLKKLHEECPAAQAMEYRRGMERAAEIVLSEAESEDVDEYPYSLYMGVYHLIRAELEKTK